MVCHTARARGAEGRGQFLRLFTVVGVVGFTIGTFGCAPLRAGLARCRSGCRGELGREGEQRPDRARGSPPAPPTLPPCPSSALHPPGPKAMSMSGAAHADAEQDIKECGAWPRVGSGPRRARRRREAAEVAAARRARARLRAGQRHAGAGRMGSLSRRRKGEREERRRPRAFRRAAVRLEGVALAVEGEGKCRDGAPSCASPPARTRPQSACEPIAAIALQQLTRARCGWTSAYIIANCGSTESLARCSRCHAVYFCSVMCQKAYWPFHRAWCRRNDFADAIEANEPKFARWMRKHGKQAVLKVRVALLCALLRWRWPQVCVHPS